jgi:hypothetical protein
MSPGPQAESHKSQFRRDRDDPRAGAVLVEMFDKSRATSSGRDDHSRSRPRLGGPALKSTGLNRVPNYRKAERLTSSFVKLKMILNIE